MSHSIDLVPLALTSIAALVDFRRREIPDSIPLVIVVSAFVFWLSGVSELRWWEHFSGAISAATLALLVGSDDRFGGGDIKLFAALGVWFGVFAVIPLALWIAIAGLPLAIIAGFRKQSDFAYAPAILMGVCVHVVCPNLLQQIAFSAK